MTTYPNRPCPVCRENGEDRSGDNMYHMTGLKRKVKFRCRSCHTILSLEELEGVPTEAPSKTVTVTPMATSFRLSMEDIPKLPSVTDRGIAKRVRELYGVKTSCSEETGEVDKHFYPRTDGKKVVNYKWREVATKKFNKILKGTGDKDLWGTLSIKGTPRAVLITEGEEDAMAAHQMLEGKKHGLACLSLPDGADSLHSLRKNLEWLSKMDEVYYCPDQDEAGLKTVQKVAELLPDVKVVLDIGEKDANAMLEEGKKDDFVDSVMRAKKYQPPFLVQVSDVIGEAVTMPEHGRTWPWPTLNECTFGMRDGEGMYLGAGVKIGKSEFINELIKHRILADDGDIPAVIKFEEQPAMTVRKLAGKIDGCFYHRPDIEFDVKDLEKTATSLEGKLFLYRSFGAADWDTIKYYIRYCVGEGSKTIIIDPITRMTNHMSASDTESTLRSLSDELSSMAHDLGFFYVVTCHLKAPAMGVPHERGGKVMSNQFRGSRAMMEACYYMLGIERNKDPELDADERNTSTFVLLEDRAFGNSKTFKVRYDVSNGDYLEIPWKSKHAKVL